MTEKNNALLWSAQGTDQMAPGVMAYLAGEDIILDQHLFLYDIQATTAHVTGLAAIDIISEAELAQFKGALSDLASAFQAGEFALSSTYEDGHSAIEMYLTEQLGDLGKKAHTGRSRNDQVLTCLRLYMLDQLKQISNVVAEVANVLLGLADEHKTTLMPGYTHLQRAMPNTVAVWLAGFAESLVDNLSEIKHTQDLLNTSPLGTAAGFGVPLPLDRELTASLLGFNRVQINPVYAQNSRGKFELKCLQSCHHVMSDVRRLAWDLSLFMTAEFDFVSLTNDHTTGSSIMPNKNNPDVIEVMRASLSVVEGSMMQIQSLMSLPSGYQRDLQLSKGPLIKGIETTKATLQLLPNLLNSITFKTENMAAAVSEDMLATDHALEAVKNGAHFRDAYLNAKSDNQSDDITVASSIANRVSLGGAANLGLDLIKQRLDDLNG